MNASIVDVLIENIKTDQGLLKEIEVKIDEAKNEKQVIVNRLKEQQKDISTMLKYADEKQQLRIEELGFDFSEEKRSVNTIASTAYEIILKAKDNTLTNEQLFNAYLSLCIEKREEAVNYTAFNIKCRTLFNTQKLLRKKGADPKSSREDIISLNGRVVKKEEPIPEKKDEKNPSASKKQHNAKK